MGGYHDGGDHKLDNYDDSYDFQNTGQNLHNMQQTQSEIDSWQRYGYK